MSGEKQFALVRMRAWAGALALAAVCLAVFASSAAAVPARFWGVVPQASPSLEQLKRLKRGGADSVRIPIGWSAVQPVKGQAIDWSGTDSLVEAASRARLEVLPFLDGAPAWAVKADPRYGSPQTLPVRNNVQRTGWKRFLKQAVQRYGPTGRFWAENPDVPKRPIRTWQIWNEENFKYFIARPNPSEYGKLVKLSYAAIHSADRGAKIVLGGMFATPIEATFNKKPPQAYFAGDFLDRMYRSTPGIKAKFDGVALHPYTGTYTRLPEKIEEVREVLRKHRDAGKGLWITELGWSSEPPTRNNSFAKGVNGQVKQLKGAFSLLKRKQRQWRIKRVYWFSVDDLEGACNFCDGSGLFAEGFKPKKSWYAYVRFAGGRAK